MFIGVAVAPPAPLRFQAPSVVRARRYFGRRRRGMWDAGFEWFASERKLLCIVRGRLHLPLGNFYWRLFLSFTLSFVAGPTRKHLSYLFLCFLFEQRTKKIKPIDSF